MQLLKVKLIKNAMDALNESASALNMTREEAFEYLVRNTLKVSGTFGFGGYAILVDKTGKNGEKLSFPEEGSSLLDKVASKFRRSQKQPVTLESEEFSAFVETRLIEDVDIQASVFGLTSVELINRLLAMGSILALHLIEGRAYAFGKKGGTLGKIEFTRR